MSHDTHHHGEGKKAVFGAPVIMGLSFWLFAFFFLSLCNGKKEHGNHEAHGTEQHGAKTEQVEAKAEKTATAAETVKETETTPATDTTQSVETTPTTEEAHH